MQSLKTDDGKIDISFDIFGILKKLWAYWWLLLITGAISGMLYHMFCWETYSPKYQTKASFQVMMKSTSTGTTADLNTLTISFAQMLPSQMMQDLVIDDLDLLRFPGTIHAQAVEKTNILELYVTADSPQMSFQLMKSILKKYPQLTTYVAADAVLEELKAPKVPLTAYNAINFNLSLLKGFGAGFLLMFLFLFIKIYFRDTIKSESDISQKLDTAFFSSVREEKKRGKRRKSKSLLITDQRIGFYFSEDYKKIHAKLKRTMKEKNHKILLVTSALANEGKSTVSANIALSLAQNGKKVLLIDADLRKPSLLNLLSMKSTEGVQLTDILEGKAEDEITLTFDEKHQLYLIAQKDSVLDSCKMLEKPEMKRFLQQEKEKMDYIIIDSAPLKITNDAALISALADETLLVVRQDFAKAKDINDAIDMLSQENGQLIGCLYNREAKNPIMYRQGRWNRYYYGYGYGYGQKYGYGRKYGYAHTEDRKSSVKSTKQGE